MFNEELLGMERDNLTRRLRTVQSADGIHAQIDGRPVRIFCSNDYLGLAAHPGLNQAAQAAAEQYGFGSGASRLISGTTPLHRRLESKIAEFKDSEAALLFNSGYAANTGIIPALVSSKDLILSDYLNHASIIDGCRLSKARTFVYRHKDLNHVEALLKHANCRRKLIVTDGVFSMDGDIAPLPGLVELAERYGAWIMVDDAHGTGVLGPNGKGTAEHFGLAGRVHIQMGTLGKAFGSFGAYAAGNSALIEYLISTARSFMFSTALPPLVCAASLAAIGIVGSEPDRRRVLWENRNYLVNQMKKLNLDVSGSETPIIPIQTGSSSEVLTTASTLMDNGFFVAAIRPPTVPEGTARIRLTVTASHTPADIDALVEALRLTCRGSLSSAQPHER